MNSGTKSYEPRKNSATYTVANILRFVGAIISIATGTYFFIHFKDIPANEFELYFHIIFLILGLGIGLGLIGIAEIVFTCTQIDDSIRRGL